MTEGCSPNLLAGLLDCDYLDSTRTISWLGCSGFGLLFLLVIASAINITASHSAFSSYSSLLL